MTNNLLHVLGTEVLARVDHETKLILERPRMVRDVASRYDTLHREAAIVRHSVPYRAVVGRDLERLRGREGRHLDPMHEERE